MSETISYTGVSDCAALFGDAEIIERAPSIMRVRDALYVPIGVPNAHAGIFEVSRRPVVSSLYLSATDHDFRINSSSFRYSDIKEEWPEQSVIYGGYMHPHFGHYLLSTFSRLWPIVSGDLDPHLKIAVHTSEEVTQYFEQRRWARDLIESIGLSVSSFITFSQPTRIRELIIPSPSFEERSHAHRAFADLCQSAGRRLAKDVPVGSSRPVYLSKEKLTSGVRKVVNEDEVATYLAAHGVDIVYPETLSVAHQAAMWRDRSAVASIVSSGLHAAILAPGKAVVAVSDSFAIISSFAIVDRLTGARSKYLGLHPGEIERLPDDPSFSELTRLANPMGLAEIILHALEDVQT